MHVLYDRLPGPCSTYNIWSCDGIDKKSCPQSHNLSMHASVGCEKDWKSLSCLASPVRGLPPGLNTINSSSASCNTENHSAGLLPPPDTKDLMSAALSNSVSWLQSNETNPTDFISNCLSSSTAISSGAKAGDFHSPHTSLLAQVHATLQALQVHNSASNRSRLFGNESSTPSLFASEQLAGKNSSEAQRNDATHSLAGRDSSGLVIPAIGNYAASHCNNIIIRHPVVKLPSGSQMLSEVDGVRNALTNFIQPVVTGIPVANTMRPQWIGNQTTSDHHLTLQKSVAEQFYYQPLPTQMSAFCFSGAKLNRSVDC